MKKTIFELIFTLSLGVWVPLRLYEDCFIHDKSGYWKTIIFDTETQFKLVMCFLASLYFLNRVIVLMKRINKFRKA